MLKTNPVSWRDSLDITPRDDEGYRLIPVEELAVGMTIQIMVGNRQDTRFGTWVQASIDWVRPVGAGMIGYFATDPIDGYTGGSGGRKGTLVPVLA